MTKKNAKLSDERYSFVLELLLARRQGRLNASMEDIARATNLDASTVRDIDKKRHHRWTRRRRCGCGSMAVLFCHACYRSDWEFVGDRAVQMITARRLGLLPRRVGRTAIAKLCDISVADVRRFAGRAAVCTTNSPPCRRCGCPAKETACRPCFIRKKPGGRPGAGQLCLVLRPLSRRAAQNLFEVVPKGGRLQE